MFRNSCEIDISDGLPIELPLNGSPAMVARVLEIWKTSDLLAATGFDARKWAKLEDFVILSNQQLQLTQGKAGFKPLGVAEKLVLGRGNSYNLDLMHPAISRVHLGIFRDSSSVIVRDLGSTNGTKVII